MRQISLRAHPGRQPVHQIVPVDKPLRLRIAADDGGGQHGLAHGIRPGRCSRSGRSGGRGPYSLPLGHSIATLIPYPEARESR